MTTTEALASLIVHQPKVIWTLTEENFYFPDLTRPLTKKYQIAFFPQGILQRCEQVTDNDLDRCVEQAKLKCNL